jgi:hypothetical protein
MEFAGLVTLAIAAIAVFDRLSRHASADNEGARQLAILESTLLLVLAAIGLLGALVLLGLRCDESCDENLIESARTGQWWHTQDAWQWWGQFLVALAGTAAIFLALLSTVRRRHDRAPMLLLVAGICFGGWAVFLAPLGEGLGI